MDWRTTTFDWNRARAFLVAAEEGSYSAAARALGLTQPTVGRQVAALEDELGVVLFRREGRRLEPTEAAVGLLGHARAMGEAARALSLAAAGQTTQVDGTVRITASQLISAHLLGPALAHLRREHPGLHLELVASNAVRDLRRREADIAVRNVAPTEPELIGRRLPDAVARPYAHRRLHETTTDWAAADWFGFDGVQRMVEGLLQLGYPVQRASFTLLSEDHLVQWQLARQGLGVCLVMQQVGDADSSMQPVLPELPGIPIPMWLVTHRELHTSRRIRLVFDTLVRLLGEPRG